MTGALCNVYMYVCINVRLLFLLLLGSIDLYLFVDIKEFSIPFVDIESLSTAAIQIKRKKRTQVQVN